MGVMADVAKAGAQVEAWRGHRERDGVAALVCLPVRAGGRGQVNVGEMGVEPQRVALRRQQPRKHRRTSEEVDLLRARALLDDELAELSDAEREWVWRSLLKGIRVEEACVLALLDLDRLDEAMEAVRHRYELRALEYKARRARGASGSAEGRVVAGDYAGGAAPPAMCLTS